MLRFVSSAHVQHESLQGMRGMGSSVEFTAHFNLNIDWSQQQDLTLFFEFLWPTFRRENKFNLEGRGYAPPLCDIEHLYRGNRAH